MTISDPRVVHYHNGVVTGLTPGRATITFAAQDGSGVTAQATVTVREPPPVQQPEVLGLAEGFPAVFQIVALIAIASQILPEDTVVWLAEMTYHMIVFATTVARDAAAAVRDVIIWLGNAVVSLFTPLRPKQPTPFDPMRYNNTDINVQLPASGLGFTTHLNADRRWGTQRTINTISEIGRQWSSKGWGPISVGNISYQDGGPMPPHASHQYGVDVDIRPIRTDGTGGAVNIGSNPNAGNALYSRERTRELIRLILAIGDVDLIFFNDLVLVNEFAQVRYVSGHYGHLHVRFNR